MASVALLLAVWSLLLAGSFLEPLLGAPWATCATFLAAALLVGPSGRRGLARPARALTWALGGCLAGSLSYPAWVTLIAGLGAQIGLAPVAPPPATRDPRLLIATLLLAPLFEETLYRERLLRPFSALLGWPGASVLTSGLFALPHVAPWGLLGTFLVGLALAASRGLGCPLAFCVGVHSGLNLVATLSRVSPA